MAKPLRVLFVEDSEDDVLLILAELKRGGYGPTHLRVETAEAMAGALAREPWDVVLSDNRMPHFDGARALEVVKESGKDVPFILLSGAIGESAAVEIMKAGAHDFVWKDNLGRLVPAIDRGLRDSVVRAERRQAVEALRKAHDELERRVEERTSELSEANRKLREEVAERKLAQEDRDRMTAQLLQGQKLQAIGQLAAGVAHEINNPLGYILSNLHSLDGYMKDLASLLEKAVAMAEAKNGDAARQQFIRRRKEIDADFMLQDFGKAIEESAAGGERIREIVKSLREFAHPDEGERRTVDLQTVIESALRLCANQIRWKADIRKDFGPLPPVSCFPSRIEQAIVNLLINAAQAIKERGEITVSTRHEEAWAVVRIRDTGCGIQAADLGKIFEPFYTTKPVGSGTGLGLHVTYKIVRGHGGSIDVTSEVGKGTEFTIRIPVGGSGQSPR
jgi:signal transduction histidine kinase